MYSKYKKEGDSYRESALTVLLICSSVHIAVDVEEIDKANKLYLIIELADRYDPNHKILRKKIKYIETCCKIRNKTHEIRKQNLLEKKEKLIEEFAQKYNSKIEKVGEIIDKLLNKHDDYISKYFEKNIYRIINTVLKEQQVVEIYNERDYTTKHFAFKFRTSIIEQQDIFSNQIAKLSNKIRHQDIKAIKTYFNKMLTNENIYQYNRRKKISFKDDLKSLNLIGNELPNEKYNEIIYEINKEIDDITMDILYEVNYRSLKKKLGYKDYKMFILGFIEKKSNELKQLLESLFSLGLTEHTIDNNKSIIKEEFAYSLNEKIVEKEDWVLLRKYLEKKYNIQ